MKHITMRELEFLKEATEWRDISLIKGKNPQTYRDREGQYIALFHDKNIEILELGREVAFFIDIQQSLFLEKE